MQPRIHCHIIPQKQNLFIPAANQPLTNQRNWQENWIRKIQHFLCVDLFVNMKKFKSILIMQYHTRTKTTENIRIEYASYSFAMCEFS